MFNQWWWYLRFFFYNITSDKYSLIFMLEISALIYNFIWKITKLSWQRSARPQGLKGYEGKCQGIKRRRFRKAKHKKKHIKKDSYRKIPKFLNFRFMLQTVFVRRYNKQVTPPHPPPSQKKKRDSGRYLRPVIFIGNQMVWPTTSLWREHLISFKIVFLFYFNSQGSPACKVDCLWGFVVWSVHNTKWRVSSEH